jgi:hypothetical protein
MRAIALLLLTALVACGDDDGSGPSTPADVAGTWSASMSNLSGSGISCSSSSPTQLTLNQTGETFTGSYAGGEMACTGPGGGTSFEIEPGTVINGSVDGNSVTFDLDTPDARQTGTVDGNSMSGTARWTIDLGALIGIVTLNGTWSAARQ